jgi:hypothetical protein
VGRSLPLRFLLTGFPIATRQSGRQSWAMRPDRAALSA